MGKEEEEEEAQEQEEDEDEEEAEEEVPESCKRKSIDEGSEDATALRTSLRSLRGWSSQSSRLVFTLVFAIFAFCLCTSLRSLHGWASHWSSQSSRLVFAPVFAIFQRWSAEL